jgi:predicted permease
MNTLVAAQVAFGSLVLFIAGLFMSTFQRLTHEPLGFSTARVLTLDSSSKNRLPADLWYQEMERLRALPSVESAAIAGFPLMSNNAWTNLVWANGHAPEGMLAPSFLDISPGWFDTMKIPLLGGRDFHPEDTYPQVAAVNETFARRYFDGRNPVGGTLETIEGKARAKLTIVGYVRDARYNDIRRPIPPTVYVPFRRAGGGRATGNNFAAAAFILRTTEIDPVAVAPLMRQEIPREHPELRVANLRTQEELVRSQTIRERMLAMLSLFFAAVALVLAGVGLYGVLNYAVLHRRRELGIRIALGAQPSHIANRVSVEEFSMLLIGATAGLSLGIASERYIATVLYQVKVTDALILAAPAITILAAAALAALPPVVRAIRIDPTETLRSQ